MSTRIVLHFFVPEGGKKSRTESCFKYVTDHAYEGEDVTYEEVKHQSMNLSNLKMG